MSAIAIDGTRVYWADSPGGAAGTMKSALLEGGDVTTLARNVFAIDSLAEDPLNLYFSANTPTGAIYTMPKTGVPDGGVPTVLVPSQNEPAALVVDGDKMFWVNAGATGNGGSVFGAQIDGGGTITIAKFQSEPRAIALDADYVYWVDGVGPRKAPRAGGPVTTLAWGQGLAQGIAVDATSVYWTSWSNGTVMKRTPK